MEAYFRTTNIVTKLTGLDLIREAVVIVPKEFVNDFLFYEDGSPDTEVDTDTFLFLLRGLYRYFSPNKNEND